MYIKNLKFFSAQQRNAFLLSSADHRLPRFRPSGQRLAHTAALFFQPNPLAPGFGGDCLPFGSGPQELAAEILPVPIFLEIDPGAAKPEKQINPRDPLEHKGLRGSTKSGWNRLIPHASSA